MLNTSRLFWAFFTLLGFIHAGSTATPSETLTKLLEGYDKRLRPNLGGPPVEVGVTMYFIRLYDISTKHQTATSDSYFRQSWSDPRLAFTAPEGVEYFNLGPEDMKNFWQPDTFLPTGTAKFSHDSNAFFRISRNGTVFKSVRLLATTWFPMQLRYFPADKQEMGLEFESYGFGTKDITYHWKKGDQSIGLSPDCGTPDYQINGHQIVSQSLELSTGTYSRLAVVINMSRNSGYFCRHFYTPAILAFLLVWATFWFPAVSSAIRILLILVAFVTSNFLMFKTSKHLPVLAYSTMLEKYITFTMAMSALAVIPLIVVVYLHGKSRKVQVGLGGDLESSLLDGEKNKKEADEGKDTQGLGSYFGRSIQYMMTIREHRRSYQKVDLFFRALYPFIFIVFNIWYWVAFP